MDLPMSLKLSPNTLYNIPLIRENGFEKIYIKAKIDRFWIR
jgi:hypothetical protein